MMGLRDISAFYFAWPWAFLLLLLLPPGWWLYLRRKRNQIRKTALQFSYAAVAAQLNLTIRPWKRLFPLLASSLLGFLLVLGLARPTVVGKVAVNSVDMMLVIDISLSMLAKDIKPDRLSAAKDAAVRFVEKLPRDARVGLEVFAGDSYVLSPPTSRHEEVLAYLKALRREDLKPRTEIGSALHTALGILEQQNKQPKAPASPSVSPQSDLPEAPPEAQDEETASKRPPDRVIILLSDGDSHEGYPWDQAARDALQAGVVIHSIGIGSAQGSTIEYRGLELPVTFDETTLRRLAEMAGGSYFRVFRESDFRKVYEQIESRTIHYEERELDLGFACCGLALGVLLLALLLLI